MKSLAKYFGQVVLVSFLLAVVLLQTYCGPKILPQDSCGFAQNTLGQRISWKQQLPVKLYMDSKFPSEMRTPLYNAIATWEAATPGKKLFQIVGDTTEPGGHDNMNVIYWVTNNWAFASGSNSSTEEANTMAWWADNQMVENDVYVNATYTTDPSALFSLSTDPTQGSQQVDMESLMLHELGHVLGLKHIDDRSSVMYKDLLYTQIRRQLAPIDQADLKCEY